MTDLLNPDVKALLDAPLPAVVSTQGGDGSIFSTVAWVDLEDGELSVNTSVGRRWQRNLESDPHITLVVVNPEDSQHFVEVRGTATARTETALADINRIANKYIGTDYPWLAPGEQRITYVITPTRVRLQKL